MMLSFGPPIAPPAVEDDLDRDICCIGALMNGASGCCCWEPVYDLDQSRLFEHVWAWPTIVRRNHYGEPLVTRTFDRDRQGEPCRLICKGAMNSVLIEFADGYRTVTSLNGLRRAKPATRTKCCDDCAYRNGSPERAEEDGTDELLAHAMTPGQEFWCHQGCRRVVAFRHPDGRELPAGDGDYRPPVGPEDRPIVWKADGTPGERCAGWAAHASQHANHNPGSRSA